MKLNVECNFEDMCIIMCAVLIMPTLTLGCIAACSDRCSMKVLKRHDRCWD